MFLTLLLLSASLLGVEITSYGQNVSDWRIYNAYPYGATIDKTDDDSIQLNGNGTLNAYKLKIDNKRDNIISWVMSYQGQKFSAYIKVDTTKGKRYLVYDSGYKNQQRGKYLYIGLGGHRPFGQFFNFTRDIQADLEKFETGNKLKKIRSFIIRGDVIIDDIKTYKTNTNFTYNSNYNLRALFEHNPDVFKIAIAFKNAKEIMNHTPHVEHNANGEISIQSYAHNIYLIESTDNGSKNQELVYVNFFKKPIVNRILFFNSDENQYIKSIAILGKEDSAKLYIQFGFKDNPNKVKVETYDTSGKLLYKF
jgi:hypothetical protein